MKIIKTTEKMDDETDYNVIVKKEDNSVPMNVSCPFCKEGDFDLAGLKSHLEHGDCENYNKVPNLQRLI